MRPIVLSGAEAGKLSLTWLTCGLLLGFALGLSFAPDLEALRARDMNGDTGTPGVLITDPKALFGDCFVFDREGARECTDDEQAIIDHFDREMSERMDRERSI